MDSRTVHRFTLQFPLRLIGSIDRLPRLLCDYSYFVFYEQFRAASCAYEQRTMPSMPLLMLSARVAGCMRCDVNANNMPYGANSINTMRQCRIPRLKANVSHPVDSCGSSDAVIDQSRCMHVL